MVSNLEWLNAQEVNFNDDDTRADVLGFSQEEDRISDIFRCQCLNSIQVRSAEITVTKVSVSHRAIYLITSDRQLFRWTIDPLERLKESSRDSRVELTISHHSPDLQDVFTDRTGFHTLVTFAKAAKQGTHYFHLSSTNSIFLHKMHDFDIRSVAWSRSIEEFNTKELLVGTDTGFIIELVLEYNSITRELKNQSFTRLIELPGSACIDGLAYEMFPGVPPKYVVMAATKNTLYQFSGDSNEHHKPEFFKMFERYKTNPNLMSQSAHEVGGSVRRSQLQFDYKRDFDEFRASSFAWLSGAALMYGKFPKNTRDSVFVSQMKPIAYPEMGNQELRGIAMTAYHVYFLYTAMLCVVSKQSQEIIHNINFEIKSGQVMLGLIYDPDSQSLIVWSSRLVYQIMIDNEGRDVWKYYIEQNKYDDAVRFCEKRRSPYLHKVKGVYGDYLFSKKNYVKAAEIYAESNKSFEEISLKLMNMKEALQVFLELKLNKLSPEYRSQRTLLCTWLLELRLNHMNNLLMNESNKNFIAAQEDLKTFLSLRKHDLDENTTYTLLQSHGRVDDWVYFAEMKDNFKNVMLHYINQQEFKKALSKLEMVDPSTQDEMLYKYSPIFIKHEPSKTVNLLITTITKANRDKKKFDVQKLLPALMNISKDHRDIAIKFEKFCIKDLGVKDKALHNLYVFHLSDKDERTLIQYLKSQENRELNFDIEYALSVCKHNQKIEAQIAIYTMMKLYSEAVSLALEYEKLDLAKENAKKPEKTDEELSRKLWIQIAAHLINKGQLEKALEVMSESKVIKMEDLLPMFDKDVKISNFKEEICNALETYKEKIRELHEELKQSNESSVEVKVEIDQVKKRKIEIDGQKACDICNRPLLKKSFFIFPCSHSYHKDCLTNTLITVYEKKDKYKYTRLVNLSKKIEEESLRKGKTGEPANLIEYQMQIDSMIGSSCFMCGHLFIESIRDSYIDNENELLSWDLVD